MKAKSKAHIFWKVQAVCLMCAGMFELEIVVSSNKRNQLSSQ